MDRDEAFDTYWLLYYGAQRKRWTEKGRFAASDGADRYMEWRRKPYMPTRPRGEQATLPNGETAYKRTRPIGVTEREGQDIAAIMRRMMGLRKEWKIYKGLDDSGFTTTERLFWKGWPNG